MPTLPLCGPKLGQDYIIDSELQFNTLTSTPSKYIARNGENVSQQNRNVSVI
jgi:hypothetical protein